MSKKSLFMMAAASLIAFIFTQTSFAEEGQHHARKWKKEHPRQAEVNGRLQNQGERVEQGEKNGTLTQQQANQINNQDKRIYRKEQRMKERNGGNYLTPEQQARLNHQENKVSNEIKHDESVHTNGGGTTPTPVPTPTTPGPASTGY